MNHATMNRPQPTPPDARGEYEVAVTSIGTAGARIVGALKVLSRVPEQTLALRLFQAPSVLFGNLPADIAHEAVAALRTAGLECAVRHRDEPFARGDSDHEIALVIRSFDRMGALLEGVVHLVGVDLPRARQMLCASPAVLLGRISGVTAGVLRERFAPLGADVDISRPARARYDAFLGECSAGLAAQARQAATSLGIQVAPDRGGAADPVLATGLTRAQADVLFSQVTRARLPVVLLNRDFQRFDLRLDAAPASPEMLAFLVESTGMPERIAHKVITRLPMVTHSNLRFDEAAHHVETIASLGGRSEAHLLAFRTFSLVIEKVGDVEASSLLLRGLGGLSAEEAAAALTSRTVPGPLSGTLARWLQHELRLVDTATRMVLR